MINLKTNELDLKSKDCKAHLKKLTRHLLNDSGDLLFMQPLFALGDPRSFTLVLSYAL